MSKVARRFACHSTAHNPAVSPTQYRLAQAVLSGTVTGPTSMTKDVAREIVEKTPHKLRSEWSHPLHHNPAGDGKYRIEICPQADGEHLKAERQYAHVFHYPGVICVANAFCGLPEENKAAILLHEVGHLLAGQRGGEAAANSAVTKASGINIAYRNSPGGVNLETIPKSELGKACHFLIERVKVPNPRHKNLFGFGKAKTTSSSGLSQQAYSLGYNAGDFDSWISKKKGDLSRGLVKKLRERYIAGEDAKQRDLHSADEKKRAAAERKEAIQRHKDELELLHLQREKATPPPLPGQERRKAISGGYVGEKKKSRDEKFKDRMVAGSRKPAPKKTLKDKIDWFGSAANRRGKRNPEDKAKSLYEMFHGRPSTQTLEIEESIHYHGNLAELGLLSGLKVRTPTGYDVTLEFEVPELGEEDATTNPSWGKTGNRKGVLVDQILIFNGAEGEAERVASRLRTLRDNGTVPRLAGKRIETSWLLKGSGARRGWLIDPSVYGMSANPKWKGKKSGPFSDAYKFTTGLLPGMAGIGDDVARKIVGNPDSDLLQQAWEAGKYWHTSDGDANSGVANARVVRYGFLKWFNGLRPGEHKGTKQSSLEKAFREGYYVAKRKPNPDPVSGPVILCSNESGNQMYLRAGDQSIPPATMAKTQMDDCLRDHMNFGEIWAIAYITSKSFDDFKRIEYVHGFGPEKYHYHLPKRVDLWEDAIPPKEEIFGSGYLPTLSYDTINKTIHFVGGVYEIKEDSGAGSIFN